MNLFATPLAIGAGSWGAAAWRHPELLEQLRHQCHGWSGRLRYLPGIEQCQPDLTNVFYIGYDDQITGADDNHDDLIIRATVSPAVPEPATWAMMLLGFGAAGFAMRRRRAPVLAQAA